MGIGDPGFGQGEGEVIAVVTYYGQDDLFAVKVLVRIVAAGGEIVAHRSWYSTACDVRLNSQVAREIGRFVKKHRASKLKITEDVIGCPHVEGVDYPEGESCPECPFWARDDSWPGGMIH